MGKRRAVKEADRSSACGSVIGRHIMGWIDRSVLPGVGVRIGGP